MVPQGSEKDHLGSYLYTGGQLLRICHCMLYPD